MTLHDVQNRTVITVPEAGELLSLSRGAAYRAARNGDIPTIRLGRKVVVPVLPLLQMLGGE